MPAIKRFRPNMPSRKSADSRSARFAADPVAEVQAEQPTQESTDNIAESSIPSEISLASENDQTPQIAPIVEPGHLMESKTEQQVITMPSSTIIRQPWKQESKQSKSYFGWVMNSVTNMIGFNSMLAVVAVGLAYYFFIFRKRGGKNSVPVEVEEQGERKSEGPKSVRSSLKFKSPTMILSEIRKNPSVKVAPTIPKK